MKQFLLTFAGVLAGLALFFIVGPLLLIMLIGASFSNQPANPSQMVLALDLRGEMPDQHSQNPFASLGGQVAFLDVITRLEAARSDDAVKGVYIRANTSGMPAAQAEELRASLAALRAAGKFVVAHIQSDGQRLSLAGYASVAGADEVWLQGASEFQAMGLSSEGMFLADTLRRFHLQAQFEQREEYKNAPDTLLQRGFTPAHRAATQSLMDGIYDVLTRAVAEDRELALPQVLAAIQETPVIAQRAVELKLVDRLGRPEDAEAAALARAEGADLVDIADYHVGPNFGAPTIAVVTGEGSIVSGPNQVSPFGDAAVMNSDAIAEALLDASEDDSVRAIVFRVSSGGGSVVASDQILNALRMAKARGKKIIVSMGEVAASGGYYVAADADEIVASATTITGSIGVFGGKIVLGPALEHYASVRTDSISIGSPLVTMFSADAPFTAAERASFAGFIDRTYNDFLTLVASGRHLTVAQAREVARGRVWTGAQARERRLVDHIGGFEVAVARARALAEIDEGARVNLRFYPTPQSPFEAFQSLFGASAESARALALIAEIASNPEVAAAVAELRSENGQARAEAPSVRVR